MRFAKELNLALAALQYASQAVLQHYQIKNIKIFSKSNDNSPVTQADIESNQIICQLLEKTFSYPILSEERKDNLIRLSEKRIWILDPLDGTKEFISKNDEFTINLALVEEGMPVLGLIACPVKNIIFYAVRGEGAYKLKANKHEAVKVNQKETLDNLNLVISRSHAHPLELAVLGKLKNPQQMQCGSALKYCTVAEGIIDATIRQSPLYEWDICAADCIVREAGGQLTDMAGKNFIYNRENSLITEGIIASNQKLHALLLKFFQQRL
jgi:3'(2'),5'-bisphosphate nucleotidase